MSAASPPRRAVLIAAILLAFLAGAVLWFPAALAVRALPAPYGCVTPYGALWRGGCEDLRMRDGSIGAISWTLRVSPLLRGRLAAEVSWVRSGSRLVGRIEATTAAIEIRDLRGGADLATVRALPFWPPAVLQAWPPAEGRLRVDLDLVDLQGRRLQRIAGRIDVDGLVSFGRERWALGDYRLDWREGRSPTGRLTDRGGPLALDAMIVAAAMADGAGSPPGGPWRLEGRVQARDPAWRPRLMVFGPPDPAGRHALSVEWR